MRNTGTVDVIFASSASGCQMTSGFDLLYIPDAGTYTQQNLSDMGLKIHVDSKYGSNVTIPEGGGYVLSWENGNHYGIATPEIVKHMTSSF